MTENEILKVFGKAWKKYDKENGIDFGFPIATKFIIFVESLANLPEEPWVPKMGEKYWFIWHDGDTIYATWHDDEIDKKRRDFLGVYPTKELAKEAAERVKLAFKK